jgi:hypothetical protein
VRNSGRIRPVKKTMNAVYDSFSFPQDSMSCTNLHIGTSLFVNWRYDLVDPGYTGVRVKSGGICPFKKSNAVYDSFSFLLGPNVLHCSLLIGGIPLLILATQEIRYVGC